MKNIIELICFTIISLFNFLGEMLINVLVRLSPIKIAE